MAPKVKAFTLKTIDKLTFWSLLLILVAIVFVTIVAGLVFIVSGVLLLGELSVSAKRREIRVKRANHACTLDKDLDRAIAAECAARLPAKHESIEVQSCT